MSPSRRGLLAVVGRHPSGCRSVVVVQNVPSLVGRLTMIFHVVEMASGHVEGTLAPEQSLPVLNGVVDVVGALVEDNLGEEYVRGAMDAPG